LPPRQERLRTWLDDVPSTTALDLIAAHIEARAKVDGYIERNRLNVIFLDPRMEARGKRYSDFQELTFAEDETICDLLDGPYADDEEFLLYAMTARPRFVEPNLPWAVKEHVTRCNALR
jgi:hypothetical protein